MRRIRVSPSERCRLELRADAFNAFNNVNINSRVSTATFNNPSRMTLVNNRFNADGSLNESRLEPRNAGFGAANGAAPSATFNCRSASSSEQERPVGPSSGTAGRTAAKVWHL